jgi:hypothetical protein
VKYLQRDFIDPLAKGSSGSESSDGPKDLQTILGKRMVRLVRGRPVLQIFMMRSIQALNKSAPGPAELFTIQTQQNASVDLALSGLVNNSGLPISAAVLCRFGNNVVKAAKYRRTPKLRGHYGEAFKLHSAFYVERWAFSLQVASITGLFCSRPSRTLPHSTGRRD